MKLLSVWVSAIILGTTVSLPVFAKDSNSGVTPKAVMQHYTNLAYANFSDALATAKVLQTKVDEFIEKPSEDTLKAARKAWLNARIPYGQTEAFRFGNKNVDAWEGQVNAWPLDEGLIDYVKTDVYEHEEGNQFAKANIIASKDKIDTALLKSFHEKGGSEANVATGYHAIEFLLWGQDLNAKPTDAGLRSYTDFVVGKACTNDNCERRAQYLKAATDLLVDDLQVMVDDWADGKDNYRKQFLALDEKEGLQRIFFGLGSLSLGELAGERMNVALLAHSQEDEHSCFSDNTHIDIVENAKGIQNIYLGNYTKTDGTQVSGASLSQLVAAKDAKADKTLIEKLAKTAKEVEAISQAASKGEAFDQQIKADNKSSNEQVKVAIEALRDQTGAIEAAAKLVGVDNLNPESSDSFKKGS